MTDAFFDWDLWRHCVAQDLGHISYPNLNTQMQWLQPLQIDTFRPAAVMVLVETGEVAEVVLTVRSLQLQQHGGQVAFAGGKQDDSDRDLVETALRETHEELGIASSQIEIIGQMPPLPTVSAYQVHPVIGLLSPQSRMVPNEEEVAKVFTVPLAHLMQPERYQHYPIVRDDHVFYTVKFPHPEHIWGATATILLALAEHYQSCVRAHGQGV